MIESLFAVCGVQLTLSHSSLQRNSLDQSNEADSSRLCGQWAHHSGTCGISTLSRLGVLRLQIKDLAAFIRVKIRKLNDPVLLVNR